MPGLEIREYQVGDVILLKLAGQITLGTGSVTLRDHLRQLLAAGKNKVLLNLERVRLIDSSGLGELVASFASFRRQSGQLKLVKVTDNIKDLMAITKLLTVFDVYDDELSALNEFGLGENYELLPYDGEVNWSNADEDERIFSWVKELPPEQ